MITIREFSDLHLDFSQWRIPVMEDDHKKILLLAGDIAEIKHPSFYKDFFQDVSDRFMLVLYVFGNHEHYGDSILRSREHFNKACGHLDNVHVLENEEITVENVTFIGSTMWSSMDNRNPMTMVSARSSMGGMADYTYIRTGPHGQPYQRRLRPEDTVAKFNQSKNYIFERISAARLRGDKVVVITHHHPSFLGQDEYYAGDSLNGCYYSELFEQIHDNGPDYWFCGHVHKRRSYQINKTQVVCNPRGYHDSQHNEISGFDLENQFTL